MNKTKRKFLPALLALVALLVCLFSLAACGGNDVLGKYYHVNGSQIDKNTYIELQENNTWTDGTTTGTYALQDDSLTLKDNNGATVHTCTLSGGSIKFSEGSTSQEYQKQASGNFLSRYGVFIILAVVVVLLIVWFVFSGRKNKSRQKEYVEQLQAIAPGNKVKSAGGLCGVVVEVCDDDTVIIETGSETTGKSYFKLAKESIYQTDAKGASQIAREQAAAEKLAQKENKALPAPENSPEKEAEKPAEPAEEPFEEMSSPAEEPAKNEKVPEEEGTAEPAEPSESPENAEDEDGKKE